MTKAKGAARHIPSHLRKRYEGIAEEGIELLEARRKKRKNAAKSPYESLSQREIALLEANRNKRKMTRREVQNVLEQLDEIRGMIIASEKAMGSGVVVYGIKNAGRGMKSLFQFANALASGVREAKFAR